VKSSADLQVPSDQANKIAHGRAICVGASGRRGVKLRYHLTLRSNSIASRSQRRGRDLLAVSAVPKIAVAGAGRNTTTVGTAPRIRHLRRPETGADLQGAPARVRAPQRSEHDTRPVSVRRMGLLLEKPDGDCLDRDIGKCWGDAAWAQTIFFWES
jgi:hypothetical protein